VRLYMLTRLCKIQMKPTLYSRFNMTCATFRLSWTSIVQQSLARSSVATDIWCLWEPKSSFRKPDTSIAYQAGTLFSNGVSVSSVTDYELLQDRFVGRKRCYGLVSSTLNPWLRPRSGRTHADFHRRIHRL
jgi:hypothetical protein